MDAVGDIMDVTLVPFGNARFTSSGQLKCQHGVDECKINSFEQCAISLYPDFSTHFPFYRCVEQASASCGEGAGPCTLRHIESCATKASLDYSKLEACVDDPVESLKLQHEANDETPSNHRYTPWVLVNGKLSPSNGDKLLKEVCKAYTGRKPSGCSDAEAQVEVEEAASAANATLCSSAW